MVAANPLQKGIAPSLLTFVPTVRGALDTSRVGPLKLDDHPYQPDA